MGTPSGTQALSVTPANAGVQLPFRPKLVKKLDSRFRGNDVKS